MKTYNNIEVNDDGYVKIDLETGSYATWIPNEALDCLIEVAKEKPVTIGDIIVLLNTVHKKAFSAGYDYGYLVRENEICYGE